MKKVASTLRCLKTSVFKKYKSSHQKVFPKVGVLKIQTSHNGLYKN